MPEADPIPLFIRPIRTLNIPYMITGSLACIAYGVPRLTNDADLVIELHRKQVPLFTNVFRDPDYYCPPEEVVMLECAREQRGHFNIIHVSTGLKADVYLAGRDPLHKWAMERTQTITISKEPVRIAPPEYVIIRKLEFYREGESEKHLRDIAGILSISGEIIDCEQLQTMIEDRHLEAPWNKARELENQS